ncbi:hypothetical protein NI389_13830 [Pseudoalteromonas xiamenensis]|uniref:hypothetical protein n=1 Tax=Pseudoalteromonas xiamenensis TaxID=882626 RepID=UPI0027E4B099|nr:hypothetical protein [Pseudoalteromonas xiamenensis]WMN59280.1 hypothetical protein NI389_13830 [Pseudoalteromonas xiamenensis]
MTTTAQNLADAVSALNDVATSHEKLQAEYLQTHANLTANHKAMQDWQTTNGDVNFKDQAGNTHAVPSLKKMAAAVQTVNPNPHVMTKAEFDALRELRKQQYAGSGFVEFGKHPTVFSYVNGAWFYIGGGWENTFAIGSDKPSSGGQAVQIIHKF